MNKSVGNKIIASIVAIGLAMSVAVGTATAAEAKTSTKKKSDSISSEYSKKNGWKVFYGKRKGAWVAENLAWGGYAIPKSRSSKKVSASINAVDSTTRSTTQDYTVNFSGFKSKSPVRVKFVDPGKLIPVQVFNDVKSGDTVSVNVNDGSGNVCGSFYVFIEDKKKNWAIEHISVLYNPTN